MNMSKSLFAVGAVAAVALGSLVAFKAAKQAVEKAKTAHLPATDEEAAMAKDYAVFCMDLVKGRKSKSEDHDEIVIGAASELDAVAAGLIPASMEYAKHLFKTVMDNTVPRGE